MYATRILGVILAGATLMDEVPAQCQVQKVVASDGQMHDFFGLSAAVDGDWAAISSMGAGLAQPNAGAVYVFQRVGGTWTEFQKLTASDLPAGGGLGHAVALIGDVLIAGAHQDSPQGFNAAGSVYVFEFISGTWTQTAKLVAADLGPEDTFGSSVAMVTDRIFVGAPGAAAAYVFDRIGSSWVQSAKVFGSDAGIFSSFGISVALDGDQAIVGAHAMPGSIGSGEGAAYVFEKGTSGWAQVQKLVASDPHRASGFGQAVAIRGSHALAGASGHNHGSSAVGAAYAFVKAGSVWAQTQELLTIDAEQGDTLGSRMALSADHFIVSATGDEDNGSASGSAYDYRWNGTSWIQVGKLLAREGVFTDNLGISVALDEQTVLLGAQGDDDACPGNDIACNSGSAYFFELAPTATQYGSCPTGAPCNNKDTHGGCRNSTGKGAVMAACGSGSVAADDLRLEVTNCPPNKLTLLFMGPAQSAVPFADGIRVAGQQQPTGIYRYGGVSADSIGRVMRGPGLVLRSQLFPPLGRIQSGQTWNFQFWYRDNQGPCGAGTNFSNGVSVDFGP